MPKFYDLDPPHRVEVGAFEYEKPTQSILIFLLKKLKLVAKKSSFVASQKIMLFCAFVFKHFSASKIIFLLHYALYIIIVIVHTYIL